MRTGESAKAHSQACLSGVKSQALSPKVNDSQASTIGAIQQDSRHHTPVKPHHLPTPEFHPHLPLATWEPHTSPEDWIPDERDAADATLVPRSQHDLQGQPVRVSLQERHSRKKRAESPPTPPPPPMPMPPMPMAFPSVSSWLTNGSPPALPPPPMMSQSAYLPQLQPFPLLVNTRGTPGVHKFTPRGDPRLEDEMMSMNRRVDQVLRQCREVLAGRAIAPTPRRARDLAQEMRDIEDVCEEMGDDWNEIRMFMEQMRTDLKRGGLRSLSRPVSIRAASADARMSRSSSSRSNLRSPRVGEADVFDRSLSASRLSASTDSAKSAFRTRLTNLMHVYDHRDSVWDLDHIYKEMDSGPIHQPTGSGSRPPPPRVSPSDAMPQKLRSMTTVLPRPPAEAFRMRSGTR